MKRSPETRLFSSYWDDGTLDLLIGAAIVLLGVGYVFDLPLVEVVILPLALVMWPILRRRLVEPRAGYVEFARARQARVTWELRGTVALGVGLLVLALAAVLGTRSGALDLSRSVDALPAILVALGAGVTGGLIRAWRFAAYALVLAGAGVGAVLADTGPGLPLVVGGIVMWGWGAVLLVRFLTASRRFQESE